MLTVSKREAQRMTPELKLLQLLINSASAWHCCVSVLSTTVYAYAEHIDRRDSTRPSFTT